MELPLTSSCWLSLCWNKIPILSHILTFQEKLESLIFMWNVLTCTQQPIQTFFFLTHKFFFFFFTSSQGLLVSTSDADYDDRFSFHAWSHEPCHTVLTNTMSEMDTTLISPCFGLWLFSFSHLKASGHDCVLTGHFTGCLPIDPQLHAHLCSAL